MAASLVWIFFESITKRDEAQTSVITRTTTVPIQVSSTLRKSASRRIQMMSAGF